MYVYSSVLSSLTHSPSLSLSLSLSLSHTHTHSLSLSQGNKCRHYTVANADVAGSTRVSFDARFVADCDYAPIPAGIRRRKPSGRRSDADADGGSGGGGGGGRGEGEGESVCPPPSEIELSQFKVGGFYDVMACPE